MFEGSVGLAATQEEKPDWLVRLQKTGHFEDFLVSEAGLPRQIVFFIFGYAAVALGLYLLIGGLINSPYITW